MSFPVRYLTAPAGVVCVMHDIEHALFYELEQAFVATAESEQDGVPFFLSFFFFFYYYSVCTSVC